MYYYFDYEEPVFRPPSEAGSLILQATIGCSQNGCGFCGMYKMKRFRIRPVEDLLAEMKTVPAHHREHIQRVFLADGDALVYPQNGLTAILDALAETFPNLTRVGIYASPNSLTTKSVEELQVLREKKLRILYFGLESGDAETLKLARKGFLPGEMLSLCRKAQEADLKLSVTAILGLAGQERSREHAEATAEWINALSPEYFSLLTMFRRHNKGAGVRSRLATFPQPAPPDLKKSPFGHLISSFFPLSAGMQTQAEIRLGDRNVLAYLLSPVRKAWHEAGRER